MGVEEGSLPPRYLAGGLSEKGRRESNEDAAILAVLPPSSALRAYAVLSDGMGGHNAGEVASRLAVEILKEKVQAFAARPDAPVSAAGGDRGRDPRVDRRGQPRDLPAREGVGRAEGNGRDSRVRDGARGRPPRRGECRRQQDLPRLGPEREAALGGPHRPRRAAAGPRLRLGRARGRREQSLRARAHPEPRPGEEGRSRRAERRDARSRRRRHPHDRRRHRRPRGRALSHGSRNDGQPPGGGRRDLSPRVRGRLEGQHLGRAPFARDARPARARQGRTAGQRRAAPFARRRRDAHRGCGLGAARRARVPAAREPASSPFGVAALALLAVVLALGVFLRQPSAPPASPAAVPPSIDAGIDRLRFRDARPGRDAASRNTPALAPADGGSRAGRANARRRRVPLRNPRACRESRRSGLRLPSAGSSRSSSRRRRPTRRPTHTPTPTATDTATPTIAPTALPGKAPRPGRRRPRPDARPAPRRRSARSRQRPRGRQCLKTRNAASAHAATKARIPSARTSPPTPGREPIPGRASSGEGSSRDGPPASGRPGREFGKRDRAQPSKRRRGIEAPRQEGVPDRGRAVDGGRRLRELEDRPRMRPPKLSQPPHDGVGRRPFLHLGLEQALHERRQGAVRLARALPELQLRRRPFLLRLHHAIRRLARERRLSGEPLEEEDAERKDVAPRIDEPGGAFSRQELGRGERDAAQERSRHGQILVRRDVLRDAEVDQPRVVAEAPRFDENIVERDVAVEDSLDVQGIEGRGDAVSEADDLVNGRGAKGRERLALDPLHQCPAGAAVLLLAAAVQSRKRRVLHPREDPALAPEPLARAERGVHPVEGVDLRGQAGSGAAMTRGEDLTRAAPAHDLAELDLLEAEPEARRHRPGPLTSSREAGRARPRGA